MINVLYLSNLRDFRGGAGRSLYEIIKNIDKTKVHPFFASYQDGEVTQSIKNLGTSYLRLHQFSFQKPVPLLFSSIDLIRYIRRNKIHLIHNNQCIDARYSWIAGKITRTPNIIHLRDSQYYRLDRFLINHVNANICISNDLYRQFSNNRVTLIHNGIEIGKFDPIISTRNHNGTVEVGLIGRIVPLKGQELFIEAANLVLQSNKNVHFRIYGDIDTDTALVYKEHLRSLIKKYHLETYVEFMGYAQDIVIALSEIDISVVPSSRESFGRVVVESMAGYKPVIGSNIGGIRDIITNETGILIPPNDSNALSQAILHLVENPELRSRMGSAGRARVEQFFTTNHTISKIIELYNQLI